MDDLLVLLKVPNLREVPLANSALEWSDPCVFPEVVFEIARLLECLTTSINFANIVQIILACFIIYYRINFEPLLGYICEDSLVCRINCRLFSLVL